MTAGQMKRLEIAHAGGDVLFSLGGWCHAYNKSLFVVGDVEQDEVHDDRYSENPAVMVKGKSVVMTYEDLGDGEHRASIELIGIFE